MSRGEDLLAQQIADAGLPEPEQEVMFAKPRRFRFDFCWQDRMVACEVEGGAFSGGRHVRGKGYENDCLKYSTAAILGWRVVRVTTQMVQRGEAIQLLRRILEGIDSPEDEDHSRQGEECGDTPGDSL